MSISINNEYGFSANISGISGNYTFKFQECFSNCNENKLQIFFDEIGKKGSTKITKDSEDTVSLEFQGCFELKDYVNFCKEIIKAYENYGK